MTRLYRQRRDELGFTLLELACVLLVMALLTTLAVPMFGGMMHRARAAEAPVMLEAIAHAQKQFFLDHGHYVACHPSFETLPTAERVPFDSTAGGWSDIGFGVQGLVHFRYHVETAGEDFTAVAAADLRGDGRVSTFRLQGSTMALTTEETTPCAPTIANISSHYRPRRSGDADGRWLTRSHS